MANKSEVSWVRRDENGEKLQVYAFQFGREWKFHTRHKRYDQWAVIPEPPLEDWMELLEAMHRLAQRRRMKPVDVQRVEQLIRERFPEAKL